MREPQAASSTSLAFATLASPLARGQAQSVIDRLQQRAPRLACRLDLLESPQPEAQRAKEAFTAASRAEIRFLLSALREGRTRLLVLEASDLLALPQTDAVIACVPDRGAPFDAFLNRGGFIMDELEAGRRVGVLSHRVRAQLQSLWPDLRYEILRGGVDRAMETHLRHSEIDGLVLPSSVTEHLGIQGIVAEIFAPEFVLPGPGQGTLVVLSRPGDDEARELLSPLHSEDSALELAAETAFHRRMLPDQDLPVGALASVGADGISILGGTGAGKHRIAVSGAREEAVLVGDGLAQQILCHSDTFTDLLEGDFPDGLPEEKDEDATLLGGATGDDDEEDGVDPDLDDLEDLEDLRRFEDLAGLGDDELPAEDDDPDAYEEDH